MSDLIGILVNASGLGERDLRRIVRNAPNRYKHYSIPKHDGTRRAISQPARELKMLQRILVDNMLQHLPVHPSATAYRQGMSIKSNAEVHAGTGPILKFDFKQFFTNILASDWQKYCLASSLFKSHDDIYVSTQILFHRALGSRGLRLAIGAPSSPCLSNVLMREFDHLISESVARDRVAYTRYADDLTFSAPRTGFLNNVEATLRRVIREVKSPSLTINEEKTVLATRKYKRAVTGLILTNDGGISLGHERKRIIRAAVHRARLGLLTISELAQLAGTLAFAQDVEPAFVRRLAERYGPEFLHSLRKTDFRSNAEDEF